MSPQLWNLRLLFIQTFISRRAIVSQAPLACSRYGPDVGNKRSIPLVATEQIILPGEKTTIWINDPTLIEDTLQDNFGVFASGILVGRENLLMEMASLCEIRNYSFREEDSDGCLVTIESVGRVKLNGLDQQDPYPKFHFSTVEEDEDHLEECKMVAENIETFIKILSQTSEIDGDRDGDDKEYSLLSRYKASYEKALRLQFSLKRQSDVMRSLSAMSWAAFTAMEDMSSLESYRLRALDYDNVFDRLKLAQYMLREKELRTQGMRLRCEKSDQDFNTGTPGFE